MIIPRDDIMRMAAEAGFITGAYGLGVPQRYLCDGPVDATWLYDAVDKFAALVAAAEREACALEAMQEVTMEGYEKNIADAIRARGAA